ncbi:MAG: hypothetical protein JOZ13_17425 [Alphaproteobacteria bacterium]|nr:hypothetical protein [Alphaproteobacteria bacterium]
MRRSLIASIGAIVLAAIAIQSSAVAAPALKLTGAQFLNRCTSPAENAGRETVAMCTIYVVGIADGLQSAQRACIDQRVGHRRLLVVSLWWIREHLAYANRPASVMIGNGLASAYPCGGLAQARSGAVDERKLRAFEQGVRFLEAAKTLMVLLGL